MTKYKLTEETKEHEGVILYRIELTADCWWGKKGDKGGWVQSSDNLRVYGNAMVYGEVRVYGEACVWGDAKVCFKMILIGGQWDSTPMCLHLSDDVTMNMSGPGILRIGNQHKPIGEWLEDKNFKYRRYVWIFVDEYGLGDVHNCDQEK